MTARCELCPVNTTSVAGAANRSACVCKAGLEGTDPDSCRPCAPGSYKAHDGFGACEPCRPGTIQALAGQLNCSGCSAGTYNDLPGQTSCKSCPLGTETVTGSSRQSVTDCTCKENFYGHAGFRCFECPANTTLVRPDNGNRRDATYRVDCLCHEGYEDVSGMAGVKDCQLCLRGHYAGVPATERVGVLQRLGAFVDKAGLNQSHAVNGTHRVDFAAK